MGRSAPLITMTTTKTRTHEPALLELAPAQAGAFFFRSSLPHLKTFTAQDLLSIIVH